MMLPENFKSLTTQEYRIIKLVLQRISDKDIAAKLNIHTKTVRKQISNAFKKIGIKNRSELFADYYHYYQPGIDSKVSDLDQTKEIEEELQKAKGLYKEMEQLYKDLHTDWLNLKTEKWLLEETVKIRDREIAELKAKLEGR